MDIDEPRTPRILAPPLPNTGSGGSAIAAGSGGAQATFLRRRTNRSSVLLSYLKFPWDDLVHVIVVSILPSRLVVIRAF
ncbi:hypothetical protein PVAP13_7NG035634 [Panicum virgatum]|uniref:Uncharacterized protein n=1 Tax=Panicum virgatum TaxID=38727 RepID=A0A8T0PT22_PANVG|nr:hypothetical protein PVAP13_7NG035634 [Panicum virgatum]